MQANAPTGMGCRCAVIDADRKVRVPPQAPIARFVERDSVHRGNGMPRRALTEGFRALHDGARSCPTAWCSFSGVAALISGHGRVDHAAMDDNVTVGSSLNCVTLSSVM